MKRLATAALTVPPALAALFLGSPAIFFLVVVAAVALAAWELTRLSTRWVPARTLAPLAILVPAVAWSLGFPDARLWPGGTVAVLAGLAIVAGLWVLAVRTPIESVPAGVGWLCFAVPYFAVPIAAHVALQRVDPWWVFALWAVVWLGDAAAYYFGRLLGRHKLAPNLSPNKTWEGSVAGLVTAVVAVAAFSLWRTGSAAPALLGCAALTSVTAQAGDLLESAFKRAAGVKDSGSLLPGHGGMLDRLDALLLASPVWWAGLWLLGELSGGAAAP